MKLIAYGEMIWDVYPEREVIGGAPFNFCAHLAHLGDEAYLASATGADRLGEKALECMRMHGVKAELMQVNRHPTGRCEVTLNAQGIPQYRVLTDTAYDNITADAGWLERLNRLHADVFYFNTLIQRNSVSRRTLELILQTCRFPEVFCDVNIRKNCYDAKSLKRCLQTATVLKISAEEAHVLPDCGLLLARADSDSAEAYTRTVAECYPNVRTVIYTLGRDGSAVYDAPSGTLYRSELPEAVPVVSTVGAGDCYGATFLHERCAGADIPTAIRRATERSNIVVAHQEAIPF